MTPTSSPILERRRLAAIGVKAGKSQRLIAQELNVTETTIRRDLEAQGITRNKKPAATRRKPAAARNVSRRAAPEREVVAQTPTKRINLPPRPVFTPRVVAKPLQPEPPKPRSPEIPLSPEQLRRRRLEEMLQLVGSWLLERKPDYWLAINVLDKAWNHLAASPNFFVRGLPESTMSAAQLRDHTRPPGMDSASRDRREEVCALWLARWLADWAREDKQLRKEVLDQIRALVTA